MYQFDGTQPIDAEISLGIGYIEVFASDRDGITADVRPTNPSRSGDTSLAAETTVSYENGRLRIRSPRRLNLFGQSDSVDVTIEVPNQSRVIIETGFGSVRLRGRFGESRIVAKYGSVTAESITDLDLVSPYGTVEIHEISNRLNAQLGHGQARIDALGGIAHIRGSHGPISLGTTSGAVEVATAGPLTIDRAESDVTAKSAHGGIRIREARGGAIRLENGHAEVEVGVPTGVAAWIDATSTRGTVRNELTPDPAASASERTVELRLRANWGDVIIRRVNEPVRTA